jgi:hypothetical protein
VTVIDCHRRAAAVTVCTGQATWTAVGRAALLSSQRTVRGLQPLFSPLHLRTLLLGGALTSYGTTRIGTFAKNYERSFLVARSCAPRKRTLNEKEAGSKRDVR